MHPSSAQGDPAKFVAGMRKRKPTSSAIIPHASRLT